MVTQNKILVGIVLSVGLLLLIPLVAMQFTEEVNWSLFDFIVAGVLLLGTGLIFELILRTVKATRSRVVIGLVLFAMLFLVWAELAVGIFGTPFAGS